MLAGGDPGVIRAVLHRVGGAPGSSPAPVRAAAFLREALAQATLAHSETE